VFEHSPSDATLLPKVIKRHEEIFGTPMETLSADMGFRMEAQEMAKIEKKVKYLAVPKRLSDLSDTLLASYLCFMFSCRN
jgi:hypothetical protein